MDSTLDRADIFQWTPHLTGLTLSNGLHTWQGWHCPMDSTIDRPDIVQWTPRLTGLTLSNGRYNWQGWHCPMDSTLDKADIVQWTPHSTRLTFLVDTTLKLVLACCMYCVSVLFGYSRWWVPPMLALAWKTRPAIALTRPSPSNSRTWRWWMMWSTYACPWSARVYVFVLGG